MLLRAFAILSAALFASTAAQADESWHTQTGNVIYEAEQYGAAVLSFTNPNGFHSILVIPGLAGNYDNRGTHSAYWIGRGAGYCESVLELPGFMGSTQWGMAEIIFDRPSFPTGFTFQLGDCAGPMTMSLRAELPN